MQQALAAERRGGDSTASASGNTFVINLVSSTTPVALTRPDHAGLNRFTFFVSRRREDGRERFRLHMGYFDSQEEAEKLLDIVRGIYPGAWAGLAPGRRLAAGPTVASPPVAPAAAAAPTAAVRAEVRDATARPAAVPLSAVPPITSPPAVATAAVGVLPAAVPVVSGKVREAATAQPREQEHQAAARALSNIREAIASLGDSATIPVLRAAAAVQPMPLAVPPSAVPTLTAPTVMPPAPIELTVKMPLVKQPRAQALTATAPPAVAELSDTGALRLLEGGGVRETAAHPPAAKPHPSPVAPATKSDRPAVVPIATRAAEPPPREEKPCYAVQLMWSVQPIAMAQVPQLAIFSAYTLYGAEGNRDGRRWYGLRLGFFTDAVSAKQVAHYVRADFSTVSVVPVTVREREQARLAAGRAAGTPTTAGKPAADTAKPSGAVAQAVTGDGAKTRSGEFDLIDDKESLTIKTAKPGGAVQLRPGVPVRATRGAPGKRAKQRPPGQVHARSKTRAMTLEETLEILGAGQLQVDDEPGLPAKDADKQLQRLDPTKSRSSKLTRLFERLSDRLGN